LIYVYKDNFSKAPFTISYQFLISLQYNPFNDVFYIISKDSTYNLVTIHTLVPTFNCALANYTIFNSSSPYDLTCNCNKGMLFDKETFSCQNSTCGNPENPCQCSQNYNFNSFNLKCELDCNYIPNALPVQAYGNTAKCPCSAPFVWNSTSNDCSSINCSMVNHSSSSNVSTSCSCLSSFVWNDGFQTCVEAA
jgi:hypothetical protein